WSGWRITNLQPNKTSVAPSTPLICGNGPVPSCPDPSGKRAPLQRQDGRDDLPIAAGVRISNGQDLGGAFRPPLRRRRNPLRPLPVGPIERGTEEKYGARAFAKSPLDRNRVLREFDLPEP